MGAEGIPSKRCFGIARCLILGAVNGVLLDGALG